MHNLLNKKKGHGVIFFHCNHEANGEFRIQMRFYLILLALQSYSRFSCYIFISDKVLYST